MYIINKIDTVKLEEEFYQAKNIHEAICLVNAICEEGKDYQYLVKMYNYDFKNNIIILEHLFFSGKSKANIPAFNQAPITGDLLTGILVAVK